MLVETICLTINNIDFEAVVEYTPAVSKTAVTHLAPENCSEAESQDVELLSLYLLVSNGEVDTFESHDVSFLINHLENDIKEQLND